ncbi:hypothetical protein QKU48_gp0164 [Fadolivirus algeromassiliense]|jgi:hypothetical protein|uniref:Uncharacterized protein n=1 Tax=Fadolivirus FV1/VV64 TaxID=3070911 RepID=A0A7D3R0E6_9VIRU|nr:hypothetical protein QKU48_gp0164 [Fadolivirus algeromassiliense]QKF93622.1 hypothetical protein Fadolivirus_1_164 [Fadolivirus FV1/VV64]
MLKKFYIVNNQKDLLSGEIIPRKVLDYLPASTVFGTGLYPVPIQKHTGLTINPASQVSLLSPVSPFGLLSPASPIGNVSMGVAPLFSSIGMGPMMAPMVYGPPIIKMGPIMAAGGNVSIHIISNVNIFTIIVPFRYVRKVLNDIYLNSVVNDTTKPKITFRVVAPGNPDSSVTTTYDKMVEIVKDINNKYSNITYRYPDGRYVTFPVLLNALLNSIRTQVYSNINPNDI